MFQETDGCVCAGTLVYKCISLSVRVSFSREKANSFNISHPGISLRERDWLLNLHGYSIFMPIFDFIQLFLHIFHPPSH